jgi:hypothetical protein
MILLWGLPADEPLAVVHRLLAERGAPVVFLDQRRAQQTRVSLRVDGDVAGTVDDGRRVTDLAAVSAVYLRPHDSQRIVAAQADSDAAARVRASAVEDALSSWADLTPARVVNRPEAMGGNGSKPFQSAQIRAAGFTTPETLITTDAAEAMAFWERHGVVVYKSISAVRSIVARLGDEHRARFDDLRWCPTQFQAYVPGRDVRVHVVGECLFASEIASDVDDYRYANRLGGTTIIRATTLPTDGADRCRDLVAGLGLLVAGVDLRQTPDGAWCCFEVNPSPGYTYYQERTDQPIAEAIADLLVGRE